MIDGANIFQQIKAVEWPAIKDLVLIQLIMQVGNILSIGFEKAYALQTDLNLPTSEIISTYVYKKGLLDRERIRQLYTEPYKEKNITKFRNTKISIERKVAA